MRDFTILCLFFVIACPLGAFSAILIFGDISEGLAIFLVALAVALNYMDHSTNVEVR